MNYTLPGCSVCVDTLCGNLPDPVVHLLMNGNLTGLHLPMSIYCSP